MSRLSIEIDPEQHRQIKMLATFAGMSIKDYILTRTIPQSSGVEDTTEKLLGNPENAKRLREALATPDKQHLVFNDIDGVKDALGI